MELHLLGHNYISSMEFLPPFKGHMIYTLSIPLLLLSIILLCPSHLRILPGGLPWPEILRNGRYTSPTTCDYSSGRWVHDEVYGHRTYYSEECPFLDPGFRCRRNGRADVGYLSWRWKPDGCELPSFNASEMLERSRNRRIVFAGDSIGRNQWESLVCMLAQAVLNRSSIYEENGNPISKHKGYLSIRFGDHNLTVEYYRVPFLVTVDRPPSNSSEQIHGAIRIDHLHWRSKQWAGADVLVFNAGHWWNKDKTLKMGYYFQEGDAIHATMDVEEAFRRSLKTWKTWVIDKLEPERSHVFFRSYSPVHFRGGTWNEGGRCDLNMAPQTNYTELESEPWNNKYISQAVRQIDDLKWKVRFLNITYLTEFRIDGHPSVHREPGTPVPFRQDCSHWCLPGVPDTWNEVLYAHLLSDGYNIRRNRL